MSYQIQCITNREHNGKVSIRKTLVSYEFNSRKGQDITLGTRDDAHKLAAILAPADSEPYILSQGERDRPRFEVVEGGLNANAVTLARAIELIGESDYYYPTGQRRPTSEILGEDN